MSLAATRLKQNSVQRHLHPRQASRCDASPRGEPRRVYRRPGEDVRQHQHQGADVGERHVATAALNPRHRVLVPWGSRGCASLPRGPPATCLAVCAGARCSPRGCPHQSSWAPSCAVDPRVIVRVAHIVRRSVRQRQTGPPHSLRIILHNDSERHPHAALTNLPVNQPCPSAQWTTARSPGRNLGQRGAGLASWSCRRTSATAVSRTDRAASMLRRSQETATRTPGVVPTIPAPSALISYGSMPDSAVTMGGLVMGAPRFSKFAPHAPQPPTRGLGRT